MKRLLAILFFLAGGLATEIAHPVQCTLMAASGVQQKRRRNSA
ncbi:hypothetical protein [Paraburkholderia sp. C35]|nr:hypothetical protein [Paraburkholderia sp. C35]